MQVVLKIIIFPKNNVSSINSHQNYLKLLSETFYKLLTIFVYFVEIESSLENGIEENMIFHK